MSPLVCRQYVLRVQASAGLLAGSHTRTQRLQRFPGIWTKRSTPCVRLNAASGGGSFSRILSWGTDQLSAQLDRLIREVDMTYGTPNTIEGQAAAELFAMQFPVDLRESTEAYQCAIDVPGMAKADIKIDITPERVLTVSGERKTDLCTGWDERSQERHFGQFEGLFALADDADTSTINANLKLGVLTVTVKKKKMVKGQRVEVTID